MTEPVEVVHVAGPDLTANGWLRQRCAWCGAVLADHELANVARPLEPGEDPENPKPWKPGVFTAGNFVGVFGSFPRVFRSIEPERLPDGAGWRIPDGSCMDMDPAVTA